jgi:hypothetical protein
MKRGGIASSPYAVGLSLARIFFCFALQGLLAGTRPGGRLTFFCFAKRK